jgi:hypothetical protein
MYHIQGINPALTRLNALSHLYLYESARVRGGYGTFLLDTILEDSEKVINIAM